MSSTLKPRQKAKRWSKLSLPYVVRVLQILYKRAILNRWVLYRFLELDFVTKGVIIMGFVTLRLCTAIVPISMYIYSENS